MLLTVGCGSLKRAGTDLAVVVTSPVNIPLAAGYDSLDWGENTGNPTSVLLLPPNFVLHGLKHIAYTGAHLVDVFASPLYLLASITERNDLSPIELYSLQDGFPWKSQPWPALED